ncbi:hypothetical protein MKK84_27110 [Methylobacterium sp. E-065]|uniref:hypothetical protein n=1 Tax=Methylobacterium sp. E-065 TaxID=2836583 RepID=UPI001FBB7469|nr:hypothetical protein [Methylobacterium sp. E-065]MCJ2021048.1 hypothetical protein [Methylobacterium sp. E-065]
MAVAKQLIKPILAPIGATGFNSAGGTSEPVTAILTTLVSSAGDGGKAVPLQAGSLRVGSQFGQQGFCVTAPYNDVLVFDGATGKDFDDGNGNEVYGRLSNASSVWTLNYFSKIAGVETAFAMPASKVLDLEFNYVFSFDALPSTAFIGVRARHVGPDPAAYGWREQSDSLTVTALNTLSALSRTPDGRKLTLNVNGIIVPSGGATPAFTFSGTTLTWSPTNAGYPLETTDVVAATYTY